MAIPSNHHVRLRYRVWLVRPYSSSGEETANGSVAAVAIAPAEPNTMSRRQAEAYAAAFNRAVADRHNVRAVIRQVTICYANDLSPGESVNMPLGDETHERLPAPGGP